MDTHQAVEPVEFPAFIAAQLPRLRRALVARYGPDLGVEVTADAAGWAWEHWDELRQMANPAGYLYRVGQSAARAHGRWWQARQPVGFPREEGVHYGDHDVLLALERLSDTQRTAVVLVHAHSYSYAEAAEVLGVSVAAVTNHVHRGMKRLRDDMGVGS